jgi:DNA-binding phage protein
MTRGNRAYACATAQSKAHNMLVGAVKQSGLSTKEIARRADLDEEVIKHALIRPRNLDLNTLAKIVHAAGGATVDFSLRSPRVTP